MRKFQVIVTASLFFFGGLYAEFNRPLYDAEIGFGYRHDNFEWSRRHHDDSFSSSSGSMGGGSSSSSSSSHHNRYKETFKELDILEVSGRISYVTCINYYLRANGNFGEIYKGNARSSRYTRCEHEISRIKGKANNGQVWDATAAFGYQFTSNWRRAVIIPVVGWSFHEQNLKFHKARQEVNRIDVPPILGNIPNLHARHKPRWYGPLIGVDFLVSVDEPCVLLFGSAEWHWVQYRAKGNWNFDDLFINRYSQKGHGYGLVANLGFNYRWCRHWYIGILGTYRNFHGARDGKTHLYTNR